MENINSDSSVIIGEDKNDTIIIDREIEEERIQKELNSIDIIINNSVQNKVVYVNQDIEYSSEPEININMKRILFLLVLLSILLGICYYFIKYHILE